MSEPRSGVTAWARRMTTSELNYNLKGWQDLEAQGTSVDPGLVEAVLAEKDRRLADPNSPDFRPQFN